MAYAALPEGHTFEACRNELNRMLEELYAGEDLTGITGFIPMNYRQSYVMQDQNLFRMIAELTTLMVVPFEFADHWDQLTFNALKSPLNAVLLITYANKV